MIWWTGLAPWECEFPFPGSLISTFPGHSAAKRSRERGGVLPGGHHHTLLDATELHFSSLALGVASRMSAHVFLFITLKPRVEWFKGLCALNTIPPQDRLTSLQSGFS